ncbi:histidine phosphatase family protein [Nocardia sp. NPDC055321]
MALQSLTMVRHGESTANAEAAAASRAGAEEYDKGPRDPDIALTELGRKQAAAVGDWLAEQDRPPTSVLCSPYLRARETADIALRSIRTPPVRYDERLRDRDVGIMWGLTALGIRRRYPLEHRERERMGRFYYRPPGGEAWTDVALRLRSVLREMDGDVLVFAHDNVVVLTRYILERLDEPAVLRIESTQLPNASISRWERGDTEWKPVLYGSIGHLSS